MNIKSWLLLFTFILVPGPGLTTTIEAQNPCLSRLKSTITELTDQGLSDYLQISSRGRLFPYKKFGTTLYSLLPDHPRPGFPELDSSASAIIIGLHGGGGLRSSGLNYIQMANSVSKYQTAEGKTVAFMSVDLPFHGEGPTDIKFRNIDHLSAWLKSIVDYYHKSGLPIYLIGHSMGAGLAHELIRQYPEIPIHTVYSVAHTGPLNKPLAELYRHMVTDQALEKFMADHKIPLSPVSSAWAFEILGQIKPIEGLQKFPGRVEVIAGDQDVSNTPAGLRLLASQFTHGHATIVPDEGHLSILKHAEPGHKEKMLIRKMMKEITGTPTESLSQVSTVPTTRKLLLLTSSKFFKNWLDRYHPHLEAMLKNQAIAIEERNQAAKNVLDQWQTWLTKYALTKARSILPIRPSDDVELYKLANKPAEELSINDVQKLLKYISAQQ